MGFFSRRFVKGVARTQVASFRALRYAHPELKGTSLYREMLSLRPGLSRTGVDVILEGTTEATTLRDVVERLALYEYRARKNRGMSADEMIEMHDILDEMILPSW